MLTCKEKGYAKVNLFLNVTGKRDGYHMLDTVVTTIDLFDTVTVTKRKDDKIVLKTSGSIYSLPTEDKDNNVYKAALKFQQTYSTCGVDITVKKNIPVASGLGGSSADIVATLKAMAKLFDIKEDLKPIADSLGSDAGYLLTGGYAKLSGRGDVVEKLDIDKKLYFLIATLNSGVNTKECFDVYDSLQKGENFENAGDGYPKKTSQTLIENLKNGVVKREDFYNALYKPACQVKPEISGVYGLIAQLSPDAISMSGSGSSIFCIYSSKELCLWAKDKIKGKNLKVFVTESIDSKRINKKGLKSIYSISYD